VNADARSTPADLPARARRAYELAMLRLGATRAALVTAFVALLAVAGLVPLASAAWLAPLFGAWLYAGWRGALVWRGALGGLVAGLAALAIPMSVLRPCCDTVTMTAACTMPQACAAAGALLGLVVAATLPRVHSRREWARAGGGALLGVVSLLACRCASMFLGEAVGLLGGLLASASGVAFARAWFARP
jgi:hypothetical protein